MISIVPVSPVAEWAEFYSGIGAAIVVERTLGIPPRVVGICYYLDSCLVPDSNNVPL